MPSFDATHPVLRFPSDQLYVTPDVALVEFRRGEIGSDHFPMLATVRIDPTLAAEFNSRPEPLEQGDEAEVAKLVDDYGANLALDIRRE